MTVSSETRELDYTGDGATDTYNYTFQIHVASDLLVQKRDPVATKVWTTMTLTTDYTVAGVDDPDGGTITLVAGNLTSGHELKIRRKPPLTQATDIRNQGSFLPEIHEDALDKLTMAMQQVRDDVGFQTGMVVLWPTDDPPPEWLLCDGTAVSRTTYADLFAVIGTDYGAGNGSTTFNLPNITGPLSGVSYVVRI